MTLIECYTGSHIDNMAACLRLKPDKLILIGSDETMQEAAGRYQRLLLQRKQNTTLSLCSIAGRSLKEICDLILNLVRREADCVIDLTGGEELVIMAVGAVLASLPEEEQSLVRVQKYDKKKQTVVSCTGMECSLNRSQAELTVEELLLLHGGKMHPGSEQPPEEFTLSQLNRLWKLVAEDPKAWNRSVSQLNEFESRSEDPALISLPVDQLKKTVSAFEQKESSVRTFLDKLSRYGVIHDRSSREILSYEYASPMMQYCLQKAGNVLEVKTLLEAKSVRLNGDPYFCDCRMSVSIDWDGILQDPMARIPETRNEIDVVLMHHTTPLFISCKNGQIGEEELYKLHTVATRFGGTNVKKMLIATDLNQKSAFSNRAFMQRAWDMDIFLVTDAADLTDEEWKEVFLRAMA